MDLSRFSMEGRTVVITGGSGGIGMGCARAFAGAGANIVIVGVPAESIAPAVAEIELLGAETLGVIADVSKVKDVDAMVKQTLERFGRIDTLVNVAGGTYSRNPEMPQFIRAPLIDLEEQDFMTTFDVNVKSVYLCSKEVVPLMQAQGKGVIINMASGAGHENGRPLMGMGAYAASKAAIINLTKTMAHEWGPHIRVNCICPGLIDTPRTSAARTQEEEDARVARIDLKRIGVPEDVGRLALYLTSDAASYISGSAFDIDGGG